MVWCVFWGIIFLSFSSLSAMLVGNPAQPGLLESSILRVKPSWWSFRVGYLDDWAYEQRFRKEFKREEDKHTRTFLKFSTYSGILTANFFNTLDLYGLVGSSRLQVDEELFTKRALCWGVGGKLVIFKYRNFYIGTDVKYFQTNQKPKYFVVEGLPFNIVSNYRLKYEEIQGALGMSYRAWIFAPYIDATYILTRIEPNPAIVLARFPNMDEFVDIESFSIICKKRWGMALGLTLVDCKKASLSFEWRVFNQNAIDVNGEIRF